MATTFMDLANAISAQCQILDDFVASQEKLKNLPFEPSFKNDGSLQTFIDCINSSGSDQVKEARTLLVDKASDLRDLVLGPEAMVVWPALTYPYQLSTLKILNDFSIPQVIPSTESRTFKEISDKLNLPEDFVIRVIRHASTFHIFTIDEDSKRVSHTAPSQAFLSNSSSSDTPPDIPAYTLQDTLSICLDLRFLNTAFQIGDALRKNGDIVEPNRTAFNMAFDTGLDYLEYMVDPANSGLCETMLRHLTFVLSGHNMVTSHHDQDILASSISNSTNNDESELPLPNEGKIVDMGGGWGHVCVSIAKEHPDLTFEVKDLPAMVRGGEKMISEIAGNDESIVTRITFKKYNFIMHRNKPDDADIYMFRFVMHDWSDKYVIRILKNIVPNMKTDAHILIMDYLIDKPNKNLLVIERLERTMDMAALSILAGKERTENDWVQLIEKFNAYDEDEDVDDDDDGNDNENNNRKLKLDSILKKDCAFGIVKLSLAPE